MKKICPYCNNEFETKSKSICCSDLCKMLYKNRLKYPDGSSYTECKMCGVRGADLHKHIQSYHNMDISSYCTMFNIDKLDIQSLEWRQRNSQIQKQLYKDGITHGWGFGDDNPSRSKDVLSGRRSVFSKNYSGYDGLTDEEKQCKIDDILKHASHKKEVNHSNPLTLDYYIHRGYSIDAAKQKLYERQKTFSKDKCIEKYGIEIGMDVFNKRQEKWQNTLNNKPYDEQERIYKAKMIYRGYSKISQTMFDEIVERNPIKYKNVFYATNGLEKKFNEYMVIDKSSQSRFFLDFYVQDINKIIEFDGDYWHGSFTGNKARDERRDRILKSLGYNNILHIKECDYRKDPDGIVNICIKFLNEN